MSISFNNTTQTIENKDTDQLLTFESLAGIKFPANTFENISEELGNIGFLDRSPVVPLDLSNSQISANVALTFNHRLHYFNDNFKALMLVSDIDYLKDHHQSNMSVRIADATPRINALEAATGVAFGTIVMYYDSEDIPPGWVPCDGRSSAGYKTPDLRDRMVVGTRNLAPGAWLGTNPWRKSGFYLNDRGGETTHVITEDEVPEHKHIFPWGETWLAGGTWGYYGSSNNIGLAGGVDYDNVWRWSSGMYRTNASNVSRGSETAQAHNNLPPYQVVQYIMFTGEGL